MSCSLSLLSLTYSSKYRRMRSSLNCVAFSSGTARNKTGGVSSSGPPEGFPRFAHCTNNSAIKLHRTGEKVCLINYKETIISRLRKGRLGKCDRSHRNLRILNLQQAVCCLRQGGSCCYHIIDQEQAFPSKYRGIDKRKGILDLPSTLLSVESDQGFCGLMPD